ncbi:Histone H2A [Trichuris trichiura]|uniref:Histone H2A n=1 Tax=Trichuris trichiura TaxID=36087 RepID=A0A077YXA6_TRITR|nr:Histone H2A [Trichuris trichiura]
MYPAAVIEYFTAEILELAGGKVRASKYVTDHPTAFGIDFTKGLRTVQVFERRENYSTGGAVLPNIQVSLLPKKGERNIVKKD